MKKMIISTLLTKLIIDLIEILCLIDIIVKNYHLRVNFAQLVSRYKEILSK